MTNPGRLTALVVNGEQISLAEVFRSARWRGQLEFLSTAADMALIRQQAALRGIEVTVEELQQAADDFRVARGLSEAQAVEAWLAEGHFSYVDWERLLEDEIVTRKLREAVTGNQVEQYFAENRLSFDAATISQILVSDEDVARELRLQICEEGADFHKLARACSLDAATRPASGYVGLVRRGDLPAETAGLVVSGRAGHIVGPLSSDQGWYLFRVHAHHPARLDDATREEIMSLLFAEWLSRQRNKAQISWPLMTECETDDDENREDAEAAET